MREPGVQTQPEPEWDGPDPLIEMARKARRLVPASRVAEAVVAERERIREGIEGLRASCSIIEVDEDVIFDSVLAIVYPEDTDA